MKRRPQHAKAFTVFWPQVFVMQKMRFSDCFKVSVVRASQHLEPLVDKDVMYDEVTDSVEQDSETNPDSEISIQRTCDEEIGRRDGKDQEKRIVFFKKMIVSNMMILVKPPHEAVHHVFMGGPCNTFHDYEGGQNDQEVDKDVHAMLRGLSD